MLFHVKRSFAFLFLALALACAKPPPNLTPQGVAAFKGTQVIKSLDMLRDTAIAANAQVPPLVSTDTTRKVVTYHQSAITTIHAAPTGWVPTVLSGLQEVGKNLPPNEAAQLGPYIALATTLIQEVSK